jgi:hypothetical protein
MFFWGPGQRVGGNDFKLCIFALGAPCSAGKQPKVLMERLEKTQA